MRNVKLQMIAAVVLGCFGASVALACGWDFPWQLLENRAATLDTMPVDSKSFAYTEAHLFPAPTDKLTTEESDDQDDMEQTVHAEVAGLASDQADIVQQMRAEANGDSAFNKGAMLPAAVRLYTAGAVDFHKGDSAKAIARFKAILDLPASERRDREVWAAYMLGRLYGSKRDVAEASKSFALTRELVNKGAPDPLGLGVASFGEEARLHLTRAQALQKSKKTSPQQQREYSHEIVAAVRLYAEQAAHGSALGIDSLRFVVDEVPGVAASICDPMVQRLLVARTLDGDAWAPSNLYTPLTSPISTLVTSVQKCGSRNVTAADRLAAIAYRDGDYQLAQSLAIQTTTPLAMWVQARLAMQKGDVGEAAKFYAAASKAFPSSGDTSSSDDGAKALLVGENGVLTLSRGEYVDALEQLYPYAATFWGDIAYIAERVLTVDELKTFVDEHKDTRLNSFVSLINLATPSADSDEPTLPRRWRLKNDTGPAGQLRDLLARRLVRAGRNQEALKYFSPPEVQTSTPSVPQMVPGSGTRIIRFGNQLVIRKSVSGGHTGVAVGLLARKARASSLLRPTVRDGGHTGVGVGLFPLGQEIPPQVRKTSKKDVAEGNPADYVVALNDANTARSNVDRARGWYRAATLAGDFKSGSQIMATEGVPDNYEEPSTYFGGIGRFELRDDDQFVTDGERQRFEASAPKPDLRYHYRFVGVDEALHAADLLPPRSQAFAAVLCHATRYVTDGESCPASAGDLRESPMAYASTTARIANPLTVDLLWPDEDTARNNLTCQLYQRYLKEGAVLPWATHFGRRCPDPDFVSVVNFAQTQAAREARRHSQIVRHRWIALLKLALIALCLGASTWWFLRHRYA
jgi:tetratricopeptide (TPR) repeat protein